MRNQTSYRTNKKVRKYWNKFLNFIIPNRTERLLSKMMKQDQDLGLYELNQDNTWIERAKYRKENKVWLDISFAIAVKIMSALKANKTANIFPKTQKELAKAMLCSPQYVNKLLKGTENLQLETITNIEQILNIDLIQVPKFRTV